LLILGVKLSEMCMCMLAVPSEEFDQKKMWLKHSSEPWPKVLELWKETAGERRRETRKNCDRNVGEIFAEWPRYKDPIGYTLVSIIYMKLYDF